VAAGASSFMGEAAHALRPAPRTPLPIVILLSGRGSNMGAIARAAAGGGLPVEVRAVITDQPAAPGLRLATSLGLRTEVLSPTGFATRADYDARLSELVAAYHPALVVLAGFMRILSPVFIHAFAERIMNVHPSLLPRHRGLHTHRRVLEAGETVHGASVHFVTEELDGGPVIVRACIDVLPDDTEESLSGRVQTQEHRIYPQAIDWFARGRVQLRAGSVWMDGVQLAEPITIDARGS
jgi:phosphoribosylglycinamide formyltransferase 1